MSARLRAVVCGALVAQAVTAVAWWAAIGWIDGVRDVFDPVPGQPVLSAFAPADTVFLVLGSLLAAALVAARSRWAPIAVASVAGGLGYASILLTALVIETGEGWVGVAAMWGATAANAAIVSAVVGTVGRDAG
jgi:hypothetical protein